MRCSLTKLRTPKLLGQNYSYMISICKLWFHIMNLYVINFKSVYGTLKMDLKWRRYKTLKFMSETRFFFFFLAERSRKDEGRWQPAHHVSWEEILR